MKNLKEYRKGKGLLQKEVAKKAGISKPFYCLIENGERIPSMHAARRIANVLGLTLDKLYDFLI